MSKLSSGVIADAAEHVMQQRSPYVQRDASRGRTMGVIGGGNGGAGSSGSGGGRARSRSRVRLS